MKSGSTRSLLRVLTGLLLVGGMLAGVAGAVPARADDVSVLFSDGFEAAFTGWTASARTSWYSGDPKIGTHSVKIP